MSDGSTMFVDYSSVETLGADRPCLCSPSATAWAQTPERPLYDALPGFTLLESAATSQVLVESLSQAAGLGPADWLLVLNLTYPEHAAFGLPAPERLAYVMMLRDESLRG